jgi:hypothetical protein
LGFEGGAMPFIIAGISLLFVKGVNSQLMELAFETYKVIAEIMIGLALGTAMFRLFINHISFGGYHSLKEVFKSTVTFVICLGLVPTVIKVAMGFVGDISEALITKSQFSKTVNLIEKVEAEKILNKDETTVNDFFIGPKILSAAGQDLFQLAVRYLILGISSLLEYLRNLIFAVFVAAIPVFLYFGIMFDVKFFSNTVVTLGITLLIWPLLSSILLYFSLMVFKSESYFTSLSQNITLLIYGFAQLLLPYFCVQTGMQAASSVSGGLSGIGSLFKSGGKSL